MEAGFFQTLIALDAPLAVAILLSMWLAHRWTEKLIETHFETFKTEIGEMHKESASVIKANTDSNVKLAEALGEQAATMRSYFSSNGSRPPSP